MKAPQYSVSATKVLRRLRLRVCYGVDVATRDSYPRAPRSAGNKILFSYFAAVSTEYLFLRFYFYRETFLFLIA